MISVFISLIFVRTDSLFHWFFVIFYCCFYLIDFINFVIVNKRNRGNGNCFDFPRDRDRGRLHKYICMIIFLYFCLISKDFIYFVKIYLFIFIHVHLCMHFCIKLPSEAKKGIRSPKAGIRDKYKFPDMSSGNQLPVLWKSSMCFKLLSHFVISSVTSSALRATRSLNLYGPDPVSTSSALGLRLVPLFYMGSGDLNLDLLASATLIILFSLLSTVILRVFFG